MSLILPVFIFVACALGNVSKKSDKSSVIKISLYVFSQEFLHFSFFFLHLAIQLYQHLKKMTFHIEWYWLPCQKLFDHIYEDLFWALYSIPLVYMSVFMPVPQWFPGGSDGKASAYNVGDLGLIPGWGRSPGEGNGTPLQYSCLENPMDRGARRALVLEAPKIRTRLSNETTATILMLLNPKHTYDMKLKSQKEKHGQAWLHKI